MPCLRELQHAFLQSIYTNENSCSAFLDEQSRTKNRFQIYRNNTRLGLTSVLANSYPVLEQVVGSDFFAHLASAYMREYPQAAGDRHTFGAHVADFLMTFQPVLELPCLADIARLEWATFCAGIADDRPRLDFETLPICLSEDPEYILVLHPSVSLVPQKFNGLEIWQAHQEQEVPAITLHEDPHTILVVRDVHDEVLFKRLSQDFVQLIELCEDKQPFAHAMALCNETIEDMQQFQREFGQVVQIGVFSISKD